MDQVSRLGLDTSKRIFQLHGVDAQERVAVRRKLRRAEMVAFFRRLRPCEVALEACGSGHYWARELALMGHTAKLIAPQLAKPYVQRGKNDAADAAALCEAMSRPSMRFVPVKTADQQAALMLANHRERLVRERTRLGNMVRGHAAEFGLVVPTGPAQVAGLLAQAQADATLPAIAREIFALLADELAAVDSRVADAEARMRAWHRSNPVSQRLAKIPGIGPVTASLLAMKTPDPHAFRSGRDFAAWLGLTPKNHSTAGKERLGRITRAGDETLRSLLVVGATSLLRHVRTGRGRHRSAWLEALLARKSPKLAAVAQANKAARIAWKLMASGEEYDRARCDRGDPAAEAKGVAAGEMVAA